MMLERSSQWNDRLVLLRKKPETTGLETTILIVSFVNGQWLKVPFRPEFFEFFLIVTS